MEDLKAVLLAFRGLVNEKETVRKLIKGWEPFIHVECVDREERYTLVVRDCALQEVREGLAAHHHTITVRGPGQALVEVFDGKLNPGQAVIDGQMEVYGQDKDMVKLDALTLLLWET